MRMLHFYDGSIQFDCDSVTKLDISFFSLKNKFTFENGSTAVYPIKNRKAKISFTLEVQGDYGDVKNLSNLMKIINQPVFGCDFRYPESNWIPNSDGKKPYSDIANISACITSDISVTKVMSENAVKGGLYIVSATLEEV